MLGIEEDISDEEVEPKKDEEKDELLEQIKANEEEKGNSFVPCLVSHFIHNI
jgi:hypothetical protein